MDARDRDAILRMIRDELSARVDGMVLRRYSTILEQQNEMRKDIDEVRALAIQAKHYADERVETVTESMPPGSFTPRKRMDTGEFQKTTPKARNEATLSAQLDKMQANYDKLFQSMLTSKDRLETAEAARHAAELAADKAKQDVEIANAALLGQATASRHQGLTRVLVAIGLAAAGLLGGYTLSQSKDDFDKERETPPTPTTLPTVGGAR